MLDGVGGQGYAPTALPPGKTRYPLYRRVDRPQGPVWKGEENLVPPTGTRSPDRTVRSESLYRLSYPGSYVIILRNLNATCFGLTTEEKQSVLPMISFYVNYIKLLFISAHISHTPNFHFAYEKINLNSLLICLSKKLKKGTGSKLSNYQLRPKPKTSG